MLDYERKKKIFEFLKKNKILFIENFELKKKSWLKAGGDFEFYIQPSTQTEIKLILNFFLKNGINYFVVGNLSNIIFRDGLIKTPIINLNKYKDIKIEQTREDNIKLQVCSGLSIFKFVNFVSRNLNISGLEGLIGIPGTLGGAIYMNASSYDSYISEYIKEVEIIDQNSHIINLKKEDLEMQWRSSIFHKMKNSIILSATFEFPKKNLSNSEFINRKIEKTRNHRSKFQEKAFPNLGSLFATKDLYIDISNSNYFYKFLNIFNKILTKIILKFSNDNSLIIFRKNLVLIYSLIFNIRREDPFKLSDRTINCLINNGSTSANEAIKTIKKIQQKIKYSQKLENIIIEEIE